MSNRQRRRRLDRRKQAAIKRFRRAPAEQKADLEVTARVKVVATDDSGDRVVKRREITLR